LFVLFFLATSKLVEEQYTSEGQLRGVGSIGPRTSRGNSRFNTGENNTAYPDIDGIE
jgi:hypothetical protein